MLRWFLAFQHPRISNIYFGCGTLSNEIMSWRLSFIRNHFICSLCVISDATFICLNSLLSARHDLPCTSSDSQRYNWDSRVRSLPCLSSSIQPMPTSFATKRLQRGWMVRLEPKHQGARMPKPDLWVVRASPFYRSESLRLGRIPRWTLWPEPGPSCGWVRPRTLWMQSQERFHLLAPRRYLPPSVQSRPLRPRQPLHLRQPKRISNLQIESLPRRIYLLALQRRMRLGGRHHPLPFDHDRDLRPPLRLPIHLPLQRTSLSRLHRLLLLSRLRTRQHPGVKWRMRKHNLHQLLPTRTGREFVRRMPRHCLDP